MPPDALDLLRAEIDVIDREIIERAARRMRVVDAIGTLKNVENIALRDPTREATMLSVRGAWASELGLDFRFVESLTRCLLDGALERMNKALTHEASQTEPDTERVSAVTDEKTRGEK